MDQIKDRELDHLDVLLSERPRLLRDIVVINLDTGVLIDGLGRQEVIQGPLAQTVLPELLCLLDGSRTLADLEDAFSSIPPDYVRTAVLTLKKWGMIEPAVDPPDTDSMHPETLSFLRRQIAVAGLDCSAYKAYSCLQDAKVLVVATEAARNQGETLGRLLRTTGIGCIDLLAADKWRAAAVPQKSLIVTLGREDDLKWYEALEEQKTRQSFSWLHAVAHRNMGQADVGPFFRPGTESCFSCFRSTHGAPAGSEPSLPLTPYEEKMWLSFAALEVIYALALPNLGLSGRQFRRFQLPQWESRCLSYPRLPGCPCCRREPFYVTHRGADKATLAYVSDTALVFEEYVGLESRVTLSPSANRSFSQTIQVPGEEDERFPDCEQVPLYRGTLRLDADAIDVMCADRKPKACALTLDKLASILAITGGVREVSERVLRRWAATAGNLGSVELFVASRAVEGLSSGFYYYEARKHTLVALKKRAGLEVRGFMCRVLGRSEDDLPDALVILTGSFLRLSKKYGSFAYRLINLDAGAALSQLHMIARSMPLCARTVLSAGDDLIQEQFNLDDLNGQPTAIVEISRAWPREIRSKKPTPQRSAPPPSPRSWKMAHELAGMDVGEITAMLLDEGRALESEPRAFALEVRRDLLTRVRETSVTIKLPKPARAGLTVEDILRKRRSIREYSSRPVETSILGTALHCAFLTDTAAWPDEYYHHSALTYFVLVKKVSGVEPGVYIYDAGRHGLSRVRSRLSREDTVDLLVQSEFADAPVLIWITGNLAAACAGDGARGHRHLLLRAGAAGHRLWMAALALGLSGSIVAGLVPGAARRLLGFDGYVTASLLAFAAGYRRDEPQATGRPNLSPGGR